MKLKIHKVTSTVESKESFPLFPEFILEEYLGKTYEIPEEISVVGLENETNYLNPPVFQYQQIKSVKIAKNGLFLFGKTGNEIVFKSEKDMYNLMSFLKNGILYHIIRKKYSERVFGHEIAEHSSGYCYITTNFPPYLQDKNQNEVLVNSFKKREDAEKMVEALNYSTMYIRGGFDERAWQKRNGYHWRDGEYFNDYGNRINPEEEDMYREEYMTYWVVSKGKAGNYGTFEKCVEYIKKKEK